MKWTVTTPPTGRPVEWEKIKAHLNSPPVEHRELILDYIDQATADAETALAKSLMAQTITATFYTGEDMHLPRGPLIGVDSVTDAKGQAVHADDYTVMRVGNSDRLTIDVPYEYPVTIVYRSGYASAAAIPANIRGAIMADAATRYAIRESVTERPLTPVPHLANFYKLNSHNTGIG